MSYDAEATRRRIFQAASAEFAAHGLAGARVERIAAAAKANKQAIYLYFGGKDKLFAAVVSAKVDEVCHGAAIDPGALAESVGQLFDWYQEHPHLIRLLMWEALESAGDPLHGEEERRAGYRENVRDLVEAGVAAGLPEAERTRAAQDWMFTVLGLVAWNFAVPQLCRLVLDERDDRAALARRREAVMAAARALAAQSAAQSAVQTAVQSGVQSADDQGAAQTGARRRAEGTRPTA
ncbi:TetR family transcriptional regulator [Nonomuraea pusilla]|uniref:Transcriptional regulator, TetR family n=1 Tax=Nonomuraea pusilla TaxID=46177 RepID=A0A1H7XUS0_9ACTN|nr:TetR family transcriptional regulator [Nonomuraea pusilla]SEM37425.1 transcriptional regulator, TetR family [Nonomuraea pusilla]